MLTSNKIVIWKPEFLFVLILPLLLNSCFAEEIDELNFFQAITVGVDNDDLGKVTLKGRVLSPDFTKIELGFLVSLENSNPEFGDNDVTIIYQNTVTTEGNFSTDQLPIECVDQSFYFRAFAEYGNRRNNGNVATFNNLKDLEIAMFINPVSSSLIQNNQVKLTGGVIGVDSLGVKFREKGFIVGKNQDLLGLEPQ